MYARHIKGMATAVAASALLAVSPVAAKDVNIVAFAPGFAWANLFGPSGTEKTQQLLDFEEREGITVNMEYADESIARQKVLLDLINGTSKYDLVMLGTDGAVQSYSYAGYLEPLDGYLDSATEYFDADDVYPQFLEANTVNGQLWALPYYSFGGGVIYRKDIFEKYGIGEFPKTIEGVEEALETIKAGFEKDGITDVYPLTMRGAAGEEPTLDLSGFVYAYAGYPAWFEGGATTPDEIRATKAQPLFNTDFKPGFETFVRWSQDYGPPGIASHTWVDMMNIYGQGKAAVLLPSAINGFAALGGTEDENVRNHSAYAPSPVGPGGKPIQSFWTFSVGVSKFSNNKDEAYKTLAFMTGRQSMEAFAAQIGWPYNTYKDITWGPILAEKWPKELLQQIEDSYAESDPHYFPYLPELNEYMERIGTGASEAISGGKTVDEVLDDLNEWAVKRMTRAGYYD